jgi:hypothetical protein
VSRDDALRIAAEWSHAVNLTWTIPRVSEQAETWIVHTATDRKPSAWIVIDNQTGEVLEHRIPSR